MIQEWDYGECLMIRDETDINFQERTIFLAADITKGKKDRYVFFSVQMATELRRWLKYRDRYRDSEYCFCSTKGANLQVRSFESNFTIYGERIGKKDINPHMLRNNSLKDSWWTVGDIYILSQILGHSSVKVTEECYLDLKTEDLRKQGAAYLKRSNKIPMAVLGYLTPKEKRAELMCA